MLQKMRMSLFFLVISLLVSGIAGAQQAGGQFCVRAFEDRNGNGLHELDGSEPFLTRGVSAQLLDANNVVVATTLLDNSPTAINGVICFTGLEYAQYTMVVTSANYTATTADSSTATLNLGDPPTVFDFGGQPISAATIDPDTTAPVAAVSTASIQQEQIKWLVISGLGALVIIAGMTVFGVIIYLVAFHGRLRRSLPDSYFQRTSTGSYRMVQPRDTTSWATHPGDTGAHQAVPTDTGSYPQQPAPPSYLDDTGPNPAITDSGEHPRTE